MALTLNSWLTAAKAEQQLNSAPIWFRIGEVAQLTNSKHPLFSLRYNPRQLKQDSKPHREIRMSEALLECKIQHANREHSEWSGIVSYVDADRNEVVIRHQTGRFPAAVDAVELFPVDWMETLIRWLQSGIQDPVTTPLRKRLTPTPADGNQQSLGDSDTLWSTLRSAQSEAIKLINHPLSVIWGPPGTGKTYTLAYIAARLKSERKRLLILCPTKVAADNACLACDTAFNATGIHRERGDVLRTDLPQRYNEFQRRGKHLLVWSELEQHHHAAVGALTKQIKQCSAALRNATDNERPDLLVALDEAHNHLNEARDHYRERQQALINNATVVCATLQQD